MSKLTGYENEIKDGKILSVQINLLNDCPSKCKSCWKHTWSRDVLPKKDLFNVLKYLKDNGCTSVFFSGGEPLYYPNFSDVIDFCNEIGIAYSIISTFITKDYKLLEKVAKTAYRLHVSIDAVEKDLYKEIRGVDGFELAKQSIDYINKFRDSKKIPIRFSSIIGIYNYNKVYDIYNFAKEHNCILNYYYLKTWDGLKMSKENEEEFFKQLSNVAFDEKEKNSYISNAVDLLTKRYKNEVINESGICYIPNISTIINCDGNLFPCCNLFSEFNRYYEDCLKYSYGNILDKKGGELKKEFDKRFSKYPIDCKECEYCIKMDVRYNSTNNEISKIIDEDVVTKKPLFI